MEDKKNDKQNPELTNEAELSEDELAEVVGGAEWWKEDLRGAVQAADMLTPASLAALNLPGPLFKK